MKRQLLVLSLIIIFFACANSNKPTSIIVNFEAKDTKTYTITKVIPLETTDSLIIGKNYKVCTNQNYYVVGDNDIIAVFDKNGKKHSVFSPKGQSAREVYSLRNFDVDDESINILDVPRNRIVSYNFEGNYIGNRQIPKGISECTFFKNILIADNQGRGENALKVYDSDFNHIIKDTIPTRGNGLNYSAGSKLQSDGDRVLYLPSFYDQIYSISEQGDIKLAYSLDFGSHWANAEECSKYADHNDIFALWRHLQAENKIGFLKFTKSSEWLMLNFELKEDKFNWYYNELNHTQFIHNSNNGILGKAQICYNNEFIAIYDAVDYIADFGEAKGVKVDDNPVLITFTL